MALFMHGLGLHGDFAVVVVTVVKAVDVDELDVVVGCSVGTRHM